MNLTIYSEGVGPLTRELDSVYYGVGQHIRMSIHLHIPDSTTENVEGICKS